MVIKRFRCCCAVSIRAYGVQEAFKEESYRRIDKYSRAMITQVDLNR